MTKRIYKYTAELENEFVLEMPKGAKILTVQIQNGFPEIWAMVHLTPKKIQPMSKRTFSVIGTGHPIDDDEQTLEYIGTFQMNNGNFVGHLFEKNK